MNIYMNMSEYLYNCGIFMADIAIPSSALLSEDRRLEIFPDAEATEVCRPLMSSSALKKAVLFNHICFNRATSTKSKYLDKISCLLGAVPPSLD